MKQTIATLLILGSSMAGFSQDKSFDLSKYKFPDYKRHELEFNFNSNGYSTKQNDQLLYGDPIVSSHSSEKSYSSSHTNFDLGYQYDFLTRDRVDYLSTHFSGDYSYYKNNNYGDISKQYSPDINLNMNGFRRYYRNEDKFFYEGSTDVSYSFVESKTTNTNTNIADTKNSKNDFTISLGAGIGSGRKEKVSDLWQAHYILEKLKNQKSLDRELTDKDIYEFASLASKLKNKRFFDSRLKEIAELQALDSLLNKQGLIKNEDVTYFTTLNDYWSYGSFPNRESGNVFKFNISPQYSKNHNKYNGASPEASHKISIISTISYSNSMQLNLFWERNFNIILSNETLLKKSGKYYDCYHDNTFNSNINFGYSYFPDSRTSFSGYFGYSGYNQIVLGGFETDINKWINSLYFNLSAHYYLSPRLQISGNLNLNYKDKMLYNTTNLLSTNYNLSLRYAIF